MDTKRITIFAGHYGSGKTTLAVNYAVWLKERHPRVALCDLDIVNPYFRTADARALLGSRDIQLIASPLAGTNVEAPAMPAQAQTVFDDVGLWAVVDLGGDDRGALALGRYAKRLLLENAYEMILVYNPFRPLTRSVDDIRAIREEIEAAAHVPFTALWHNANLGAETTLKDVAGAHALAAEAAAALGLPLRMTAVREDLLPPGGSAAGAELPGLGPIFPIRQIAKTNWKI